MSALDRRLDADPAPQPALSAVFNPWTSLNLLPVLRCPAPALDTAPSSDQQKVSPAALGQGPSAAPAAKAVDWKSEHLRQPDVLSSADPVVPQPARQHHTTVLGAELDQFLWNQGAARCLSNLVATVTNERINVLHPNQIDVHWHRLLGRGNSALVFAGRMAEGGRTDPVAIKIIRLDRGLGSDNLPREVWMLHRARRLPNVVDFKGICFKSHVEVWLVTELLEHTLEEYIKRCRTQGAKAQLFGGIANGLTELRKWYFVHRDVKAEHIRIDSSGQPKVIDLGLMRHFPGPEDPFTPRVGDRNYHAPEYLSEGPPTSKGDVWAFAVMAWELVSGGSLPFTEEQFEQAELGDPYAMRPAKDLPDEAVGPRLQFVIKRCLDCNPWTRPTIEEVRDALNAIVAAETFH